MTAQLGEFSQTDAPAGLAALLDRHRGEVLRFLAARTGSHDDAEDLLQELWLRLGSATPRGPISNGRAYLFRMANNLALDLSRGRQRAMARDKRWIDDGGEVSGAIEERPDPQPRADDALAQAQEAALLQQAIAELPPGAARALRLHRFDGLGQGEVALEMGISRSGVEKHLALAMKHLRRALADCGWYGTAASEIAEAPGDALRAGEAP